MTEITKPTGGVINTQKMAKDIRRLYGAYTRLDQEERTSVENLKNILRDLELMEIVQKHSCISVAGMQGTGKSQLINSLYGFPKGLLQICSGRGERIPVILRENRDLAPGEYRAKLYFMDDNGRIRTETSTDAVKDVARWSARRQENVCIELLVPQQIFRQNGAAFILLPGFEKEDNAAFDREYNDIINVCHRRLGKTVLAVSRLCLHASSAVLLVTDQQTLASQDTITLFQMLRQKYGFNSENCVFAITKCDALTDRELIKDQPLTLIQKAQTAGVAVKKCNVVCCGNYTDDAAAQEAWKEALLDAITNVYFIPESEKRYVYLRPLIDDITKYVQRIKENLNMIEGGPAENIQLLQPLKDELDRSRDALEDVLNDAIGNACPEIEKNVEHTFENLPPKMLKDKKYLIFNKSLKKLNEDHRILNDKLNCCLQDSHGNDIFVRESQKSIENALETDKLARLPGAFTNGVFSLPEGAAKDEKQLQTVKENRSKAGVMLAAYFNPDIEVPENAGALLSTEDAAKTINYGFNAGFADAYTQMCVLPEGARKDVAKAMTNARSLSLKNAAEQQTKKGSRLNNLGNVAKFVGLWDMLDGKIDLKNTAIEKTIEKTIAEKGKKVLEVLAKSSPYILIASAAVGVGAFAVQ